MLVERGGGNGTHWAHREKADDCGFPAVVISSSGVSNSVQEGRMIITAVVFVRRKNIIPTPLKQIQTAYQFKWSGGFQFTVYPTAIPRGEDEKTPAHPGTNMPVNEGPSEQEFVGKKSDKKHGGIMKTS